jgi:Nucleotidyltransferase of unknown function (DUF6036)
MKQVFEAAQQIQDFFEANNWQFCFIGGIALQRWAKPRLTNDADLTLLTGFGEEEKFIDKILEKFKSRIDNPKEFSLQSRVILLEVEGIGVDISLGAFFFEEMATRRATKHTFFKGISLKTCSPEDLVVYKAFANRTKDWADIENVVTFQTSLDWTYIFEQLTPLVELKEEPEILTKLNKLKKETDL